VASEWLSDGEAPEVAEQPVFAIEGRTFSWLDAATAAQLRGDGQQLQREAAEGLACLRRLTATGEELEEQAMADAEARFRGPLKLFSADETLAWLERRQVTVSEWRDYLRRRSLRERWADELGEVVGRFPISHDEIGAIAWAEAVCSAWLDRAVWRLAGDAALAVAVGETLAGDREHVLRLIAAVAAECRAAALTEEAIAREIERRSLEWLRVEGTIVELPTEGMAREAGFLVRDDHRPLAEVAAECGVQPRPLRLYMGDADAELGPALLGADVGDLVGPLAQAGSFALLLVEAKVRPTVADPEVRGKAEELVLERLTERAIASNVRWHEPP
jgi:hypothetical protein